MSEIFLQLWSPFFGGKISPHKWWLKESGKQGQDQCVD